MTTKSQDRLLGIAVVALLVTFGGELFGMTLLVSLSVTGFFLAVVWLLALMTVTLIVGVSRTSGPDMDDPMLTSHTSVSATSGER